MLTMPCRRLATIAFLQTAHILADTRLSIPHKGQFMTIPPRRFTCVNDGDQSAKFNEMTDCVP
jgi:hypothetical protein